MVLSFVTVAQNPTTTIASARILIVTAAAVVTEGVNCVGLGDLREYGQRAARSRRHQQSARRRFGYVEVHDGPGGGRRHRGLDCKERYGDLAGQIDGTTHFVVPVVDFVAVLVHHAYRRSCVVGRTAELRFNGADDAALI